jgi:hypothetical protein
VWNAATTGASDGMQNHCGARLLTSLHTTWQVYAGCDDHIKLPHKIIGKAIRISI